MSVAGYLVRMIEPEIVVSDILYSYDMHILHRTFTEAVNDAYLIGRKEAERRECNMISLLSEKTESKCENNGYVSVFQISTEYESYDVCIFALYSK
jgi:hypothetical protein